MKALHAKSVWKNRVGKFRDLLIEDGKRGLRQSDSIAIYQFPTRQILPKNL